MSETKQLRSLGSLSGASLPSLGYGQRCGVVSPSVCGASSWGHLTGPGARLAPESDPCLSPLDDSGEVLGWINTRIILGVLFYLLFTPLGLCMRLRGKDPMRRTLSPEAESYRVVRQPRPSSHMMHQF